jgi:AbrB family looped-hinge helix DNA binding protein
MRITSKGQVTIPLATRERAGLLPNTEVEFDYDGKAVRIRRARPTSAKSRGAQLIAHMRGRGDGTLTTDQIMALTRGKRSGSGR